MNDTSVQIGKFNLLAPFDHKLPIYLGEYPEYDFRYWRIIEMISKALSSKKYALIDIGANIGDTIAHFRNFSTGDIIAVEPSSYYFPYLLNNIAQFGSIQTIQAAVSTPTIQDKITLFVENGTGRTEIDETAQYAEKIVYAGGLLSLIPRNFILKADTDGFDGHIILSLIHI